jgi:MFS family permease
MAQTASTPAQVKQAMPRAFWGLWFICAVGWAGRFVVPFLTLYMTVHAGYTATMAGVVMSMFGLGGVIAVVAAGVLIDRLGARRMLVAALTGTGIVATLLAVLDADRIVVALLVLLLGMTSQAMAPAFNALVAIIVPMERLRAAYSFTFIGINFGFALGPIVGGMLAQVSYSLIFAAEAGFMLIAVVVALLLPTSGGNRLPESVDTDSTPIPEPVGQGLMTVLRDGVFIRMAVWNVLFMVMYLQTQITLPIVLERDGFTSTEYGVLLSLNGVMLVVFQLGADRITRGMTQGKLLVAGTLLVGIGITSHMFGTVLWLHAICVVVWTAGELINMPVSTNVAARLAPDHLRGRYLGLFATSFSFATFIGPLVGGFVLDTWGSSGLWIGCAALALVVLVGRMRNASAVEARMKGRY